MSNIDKLTEPCRKEEMKLNILQSQDVRLRPKLNKLCSEEIVIYCKDTKPGGWMERRRQSPYHHV